MAKRENNQVPMVQFAQIFWYAPRNGRSEVSTKLDRLTKDLSNGWEPVLGIVPVEDINVIGTKDGKDYVASCLEERNQRWQQLKESKTPDDAIALRVFEEMYVKSGKLIIPPYIANACYQRGSVFFPAMVLRRKLAGKDPEDTTNDGSIRDLIPITLREYGTDAERLSDQLLENVGKNRSAEPLSNKDKLWYAKRLFELGHNEVYLRRLFSDSVGQKCFSLCRLNKTFPDLKIYDRLRKPETDEDAIRYEKVDVNVLFKWNKRLKGNPGEVPLQEAEVAQYLNDLRSGAKKGNAPKIMKRDNIKGLSENNGIEVVKMTARAIMENNTDYIAPFLAIENGINMLCELHRIGGYPEAEETIKGMLAKARETYNTARNGHTSPIQETSTV